MNFWPTRNLNKTINRILRLKRVGTGLKFHRLAFLPGTAASGRLFYVLQHVLSFFRQNMLYIYNMRLIFAALISTM